MDHIQQVFQALRDAQLCIKLKKCHFCHPSLAFLGHIVGQGGIHPDPEKIRKIKEFPTPTSLTQLRAALGLFGYYRKFIKDFARHAKPLTKLLKKEVPFKWEKGQRIAFERLKERLIKSPILQYPDFQKPFILYTDACKYGLGAVLSQKINNQEVVISYASRTTNKAEENYPITDLECLAVVWAVKHFHHYLSRPFVIVTDHAALKWLKTSKMPKGRRARWIMELQQYHFTIEHRSGKHNANADALSRMYIEEEEAGLPYENECFLALGYESGSDDYSDYSDYRNFQEAKQRKAKGKAPVYRNNYPPWEHQSRYPPCESCGQIPCTRTVWCNNNVADDDSYWNPVNSDQYEDDNNQGKVAHYDTLRAYKPTQEELHDIFLANLKEKQVIARQPIMTEGSRCTFAYDTENHHIHNYCKACKRNLPYGTVIHDCVIGFTYGKIRPGMNPRYLISVPWWKEPLEFNRKISTPTTKRSPIINLPLYSPFLTNLTLQIWINRTLSTPPLLFYYFILTLILFFLW